MKIRDILASKGTDVVTTTPDRTVLEAMRVLVENNIGSVVVTEGGEVKGILTERDVLRLGAKGPADLESLRVGEAMTTELVVGVPGDDIQHVMRIMTDRRIRHLPILEEGELRGIVSIGDVVKASARTVEAENRHLREYIQGSYATPSSEG